MNSHRAEWFKLQDEIAAEIAGTVEPACLKRKKRREWAGTGRVVPLK